MKNSNSPDSLNSLNSPDNSNNPKSPNKKGFSLVELLVVVTIMAILSVVAYQAFGGQTANARNSRRQQDLSTIQSALEIFFIENGNRYPAVLDDDSDTSTNDLVPKYLPKIPKDPAKNVDEDYAYEKSVSGKTYQLGATLEEGDGYKAYIIGNSSTDLINGTQTPGNAGANCTPTNDGDEDCAPYNIWEIPE